MTLACCGDMKSMDALWDYMHLLGSRQVGLLVKPGHKFTFALEITSDSQCKVVNVCDSTLNYFLDWHLRFSVQAFMVTHFWIR